jgi:hypothetical protein
MVLGAGMFVLVLMVLDAWMKAARAFIYRIK